MAVAIRQRLARSASQSLPRLREGIVSHIHGYRPCAHEPPAPGHLLSCTAALLAEKPLCRVTRAPLRPGGVRTSWIDCSSMSASSSTRVDAVVRKKLTHLARWARVQVSACDRPGYHDACTDRAAYHDAYTRITLRRARFNSSLKRIVSLAVHRRSVRYVGCSDASTGGQSSRPRQHLSY